MEKSLSHVNLRKNAKRDGALGSLDPNKSALNLVGNRVRKKKRVTQRAAGFRAEIVRVEGKDE